jgi:predicted lipid-binding transport protein (Tim44 family)
VRSSRFVFAVAALATAFVMATATVADARFGGGRSFGSRGFRTYSPPAITRTAPAPAAPITRSATPRPSAPYAAPGYGATGFARPGFFGGGLFGGLAAGFLGAGLFGLLFGHGFFGGLGGGGFSIIGLLLQLALIWFVVRLAMRWFAGRGAATYPEAPYEPRPQPMGFGGFGLGAAGAGAAAPASPRTAGDDTDEIGITQADLDAFERILGEVQTAFGREDVAALRPLLTPELMGEVNEELAENASRGVVNRLSDIRLLQGDLAESWREGDTDYATAAMRYSLIDVMVDRRDGHVVSGDQSRPDEVTELWTFRRHAGGGDWLVSAIQQA